MQAFFDFLQSVWNFTLTGIQSIDLAFTYLLIDFERDWAVTVMQGFSLLGNAGLCWIALTLGMLCRKKTRKCGVTMAVALLLGLLVGNLVLKNLVARPRPYVTHADIQPLVTPGDEYSFPSGHTLSSFAAAYSLRYFYPQIGDFALVFAAIIGFSRLYLHVHYLSDVLGGAILGVLLATCAYQLVTKYYGNTHLYRHRK